MAFGKNGNRHDIWQRFCAAHGQTLTATGIPPVIADNEDHFRNLLRDGSVIVRRTFASLRDLTVDQWAALERFASIFFDEFESYAPLDLFLAYRRELECRGPEQRPDRFFSPGGAADDSQGRQPLESVGKRALVLRQH